MRNTNIRGKIALLGSNTSFGQTELTKSNFAIQFRGIKYFAVLMLLLVLHGFSFGQNVGDYQTNATGNWNWSTRTNWQRYNGTTWVTPSVAEGYPGESGVSGTVTIQNGHTVTLNVSPANNIGSFDVIGSLNLSAGSITINGATIISGSLTDDSNTGINTFTGKVTINAGGSFSTGNSSALNFGGGIENNGTFSQTAGGVITFTADQTLSGTNVITTVGNINITAGRTVTNSGSVSISGVLNSGNTASTWINSDNSTLTYLNGTLPMNTAGTLTASATGNTVNYSLNGAQSVRNVAYYNLTLSGGNTKTLAGDVTVNNTFNLAAGIVSIGANTLALYGDYTRTSANGFQGGAGSNLTLGNGDAATITGTLFFEAGTQTLNNLIINAASTFYTLASDLTVGTFTPTAGGLQNNDAINRIFTVNNDITIAPGFTLQSNQTVTANRVFTVKTTGSFTNNGVVDLYHYTGTFHSMGELQFNGATNVTLGGTSTSEIGRIRVDKGTGQAAIVDVISPITLYNADATYTQTLFITNGTLKISSASALVPYSGTLTIFGATARLWLNNAGASIGWNVSGNATFAGELIIDNGTFNCPSILTIDGNNLADNIINNGTLNVGAALYLESKLTQNGGNVNLTTNFYIEGNEVNEFGNFILNSGTTTIGNGDDIFQLTGNTGDQSIGGDLTIHGGTINLFGRFTAENGSGTEITSFTMDGGDFIIDPQHTANIPLNQQIVNFMATSVVNFT